MAARTPACYRSEWRTPERGHIADVFIEGAVVFYDRVRNRA